MLTAQEIKEKAFEKAVFGGYDMGGVDDFLEEVAGDFTALQKENQTLKAKMKVLVEKIEEYRSTEDAMRLALLSAQKIGLQIENEAREKAAAMTSEAKQNADAVAKQAQAYADGLTREAKAAAVTEEAKAAAAKRASTEFVDNMKRLCLKQLEFLNALDSYTLTEQEKPAAAPEKDLDTTVKSIEDSVAKLVDEPQVKPGDARAPEQASFFFTKDEQPDENQATKRYSFADPFKN